MDSPSQKTVEVPVEDTLSENKTDQEVNSEASETLKTNEDLEKSYTHESVDGNQEPVLACAAEENTLNSASSSVNKQQNIAEERQHSIYHIKWISVNGLKTPVITQNENGPCPLIAIINVLIMRGRIKLPSLIDIITTEKLMEYLGDCILQSIPQNIPEGAQLNFEQNIHDAMAVLPKLQTGLDVNIKFTGIADFEYTTECIIFDLLRIPLYHGWLVDPQTPEIQLAIGTCSYNQLVEKIINSKSASDPQLVTEALIAESFLEKSASQLTYHGLCELIASLKEEEICILFRNNHFTMLLKHENELFQLVTDQGFLNETNVVWETLNNIEGDGQFVDSNFVLVPPKPSDPIIPPAVLSETQQIDQDYLVALSLQEEQQRQRLSEMEWEEYKTKNLGIDSGLTDEQLARRLQEEENQYSVAQEQTHQQQPVPTNSHKSRSRDCTIL